ncbi:chaperonin 10-like protein [Pisolithus marmoratus]|nr:chaperonin 10-like protein [Pisolithus marmoratus]
MSPSLDQLAILLYPPAHDIRVERVPIPRIEHPDDAIVKVKLAGLCGSDLHLYRGTERIAEPCVCGHEFVGEVVELGSSFRSMAHDRPPLYSILKVGDKVISPFTVSCGECHFCRVGFTCRCVDSRLFGTSNTPGGQAQYVRVPKAGGTLYRLDEILAVYAGQELGVQHSIPKLAESSLLLLCDNLPTGVFAAFQALNHPKTLPMMTSQLYPHSSTVVTLEGTQASSLLRPQDVTLLIAVIGLGPVGVCACISLLDILYAKGLDFKLVAVDPIEARRNKVASIYSKVSREHERGYLEVTSIENSKRAVSEWSNGVGCNVVLEAVGNSSALSLAYELVRPFGCITSVGVHSNSAVPFTGQELYDKNVSLDFGRCPVRAMFPMALDLLVRRQDIFGDIGGEVSLVDKVVGFDEAVTMYQEFDKGKCGKVLFDPWK